MQRANKERWSQLTTWNLRSLLLKTEATPAAHVSSAAARGLKLCANLANSPLARSDRSIYHNAYICSQNHTMRLFQDSVLFAFDCVDV